MHDWFRKKSVAIIGGAQSLFDKQYGSEIDTHDVVVRINRSIIIKDSQAQGNKTNVWAIGHHKTVEDLFDTIDVKNIHLSHKRPKTPHPKINYYLPLDILDELRQDIKHQKPSSGLMTLHYVNFCIPKSITVYGFDWRETPTWYYTDTNYQPHDWELEKQYIITNFKHIKVRN